MNCNDVDRALIEGRESTVPQLSLQVQEHLRGCELCRELVRALNTSIHVDSPSPSVLDRIERRIAADLAPVRPLAHDRYLFAALTTRFVLIVALGVYWMGAHAIAVMSALQAVLVLGTLATGVVLLASSLVIQIVPGSRHRIPPRLLPIGIMVSLTIAVAVLFQFRPEQNFWANNWACMKAGTPLGALAVVPFWLVLRRGGILSPRMTGAAIGLLAGLVGTTALEIHCPNLDARHILVSHVGVALLGAITGLFVGLVAEHIGRRSLDRPPRTVSILRRLK